MSKPGNRDSSRSHLKPDNEEALQRHYGVLKQYLASHLHDEKGNVKPNRARDKLLRLSVTQFMELSTDVYDELIRREDERLRRVPNVPRFLLPKDNFHPKRNQARQKLSTLPIERFRQLATDVFYELERRIPRFIGGDIDRPISAASSAGRGQRAPSRGGMRPPPSGFRGPPSGGAPRPPMGPNGVGPPQAQYQSFRSASPGPNSMSPGSRRPSEAGSLGRPLPKTFQSNTIVPNKSTMVEDDDDEEGEDILGLEKALSGVSARYSEATNSPGGLGNTKEQETIKTQEAEIAQLKDRVDTLETRLLEKEQEIAGVKSSGQEREDGLSAERNEWYNLREELEQKHIDAQRLNDNLRNELEMLKRNKTADDKELREEHDRSLEDVRVQMDELHAQNEDLGAQLASTQHEAKDLAAKLDVLTRQNDDMQHLVQTHQAESEELREQVRNRPVQEAGSEEQERRIKLLEEELATHQKLQNDGRQETLLYLQEMRELSRQNDAAVEQEEKLAARVSKLEKENDDWRQRYAKVKAQNKTLRASTIGLGLQTSFNSDSLVRKDGILSDDGLVKDIDVTGFQLAIDELLKVGRQTSTDAMLASVKQVILCVQSITSNIGTDGYPTPSPSPMSPNGVNEPSVAKLKARVTGTANSLITATKQHASASGLSPVALLDAAASNLTASVVELIKAVGIRSTSKEDLLDADLDSFYDDRASSADVERSPPSTLEVKPAPLNVGRSNTTKKANGWFRWGKGSVDDTPEVPAGTNGHDAEDEYDPYR